MAENVVEQRCSPHGRQEREREREREIVSRGPGQDIAPKDIPPVTYFLQQGPTSKSFHLFLIIANYESRG
jgi:hypothetical protein